MLIKTHFESNFAFQRHNFKILRIASLEEEEVLSKASLTLASLFFTCLMIVCPANSSFLIRVDPNNDWSDK